MFLVEAERAGARWIWPTGGYVLQTGRVVLEGRSEELRGSDSGARRPTSGCSQSFESWKRSFRVADGRPAGDLAPGADSLPRGAPRSATGGSPSLLHWRMRSIDLLHRARSVSGLLLSRSSTN
mgnify:CR=1 FL=1